MTPESTPLKVCPKGPALVGLAAVAMLCAVAAGRPESVATQARRIVRNPSPSQRPAGEAPAAAPSTPASEARLDPSPRPSTRAAAPSVPAAAEEDLRLLQEWILALPSSELRAFDESGALNRRLAQIVADAARRGDGGMREFEQFVASLNVRFGVVPP